MRSLGLIASAAMLATITTPMVAIAQSAQTNPQIDYQGFLTLSNRLAETRKAHLLSLADFNAMRGKNEAIVLDTRSAAAFQRGHIKGAINLPFSDFTDEKLTKVLGEDTGRPILIYCNNNFSNNIAPVVAKKVELALNIPTFINLHGYGYTNVWELADVVRMADVDWVGSSVANSEAF